MNISKKYDTLKIIKIVVLLALALFEIFVVINHFKTKNEHKKQLAQAQDNAINYIHQKYGIDAEILDSEAEHFPSVYENESGQMGFKMKSGDKEFNVLVDRLKPSTDGLDNYQYDEIKSALTDKISESLPNGKVISLSLGEYTQNGYLFSKYYTGNNLNEVLENCSGYIEMVFVDTDFSNKDILNKLHQWNLDINFTSFDTQQRLDEFIKIQSIDFRTYEIYAPYITAHFDTNRKNLQSGINYVLKSYDDFKFAYYPTDSNKYTDSSDKVSITEIDKDYFTKHFEYYNEEYCVSKPLSKAYQFNSLYGDICIYYPIDKFKNVDIKNIGVAWFSCGGQSNNRDIAKAQICGDYVVFCIPFQEQEFMLVDNTNQKEYIPEWKNKK